MAVLNSTLRLTLLDQVSSRAKHIGGALSNLHATQTRLEAPFARVATGLLAAGGAYLGVSAGLSATAGAAIKFESAFADVKKVVDATDEQFANMQRTIRQMSTELPLTAVDIAALFAAAGESGVATNDLKTFAEMAARVGIAFDMTAGEAGESLAKLKTQLGLTVAETGDMADAINHLSNNMASKAKDITEFMLRVGALAEMGGFTRDQVAGIGSAMIAAGAQAETAGTAMQNVVKKMTSGSFAKKEQREAAKALGLDLPTIAKQMQKDAPKALKTVLKALAKAPKDQQIALLSQFFGDEAKAFAPLIGNIGLLDQALDSVADKTNYAGSAFREYVARANTVENVLQLLRNKFTELGTSIGDDMLPTIREAALGIGGLIDTLGERATVFDKMGTAMQGFTKGLGYDGGIREVIEDLGDLLLGPADGSAAADELGRIFMRFKEWGGYVRSLKEDLAENPIAQFLGELGGHGFKLMLYGVGFSILAGSIMKLGRALMFLSGISTAAGILKTIAEVQGALNGAGAAGNLKTAATVSGTAFGTMFAAAAGVAIAAGLLVTLRDLDPKGDLGGLTKPVDDWIEKHTGWNPSKDGLSFSDVGDQLTNLIPGVSNAKTIYKWVASVKPPEVAAPGATSTSGLLAIESAVRSKAMGFGGSTDVEPGKTRDDLTWNLPQAAAPARAFTTPMPDQMGKIWPSQMQGKLGDPIRIDAASLAEMIKPSGTQDVRVTNQQPPVINQTVNQTINGVSDPLAAADAAAARLGEASRAAYEASFSD